VDDWGGSWSGIGRGKWRMGSGGDLWWSLSDDSVIGLDGLGGSRLVSVEVVFALRVILDGNHLDNHIEWCFGVVGQSCCPKNSSRRVVGVTTGPNTRLDLHRGLWIQITARDLVWSQGSDN